MTILSYISDMFRELDAPAPLDFPRAERCMRAARRMPLSHGVKLHAAFLVSNEAELLSRMQRGEAPTRAQAFAGTGDVVCFWVGPLRIPDRAAALVFDAGIELPGTTATPWDSGGLDRRTAQHLKDAERKALVQRRAMLAPDYRATALAATIFLRHDTPDRYLRAEVVRDVDPDRVYTAGDASSYTYESRIPRRVRVKTQSLRYAAARRDAMDAGLHELRTWCLEQYKPFELIDDHGPHRTVIGAVLSYFMGLGL